MQNNITNILAGFIIVMCVVFSYFLLFTEMMSDTMKGSKRIIFIVILLSYGAYRAYRIYRNIQESNHEN